LFTGKGFITRVENAGFSTYCYFMCPKDADHLEHGNAVCGKNGEESMLSPYFFQQNFTPE